MLHLSYLRENAELATKRLKEKNIDAKPIIDQLITQDDERKRVKLELDGLLAKGNQLAKHIGELYKNGKEQEAIALKEESVQVKESAKLLEKQYADLEEGIYELLLNLPNVPHESVPIGNSDIQNKIIKEVGQIPVLHEKAKPHWDLAVDYDLIDFELGNKITGSGFPVYKDRGARLQRALITYFLDKNIEAGYIEYLPPHLVNKASGYGTGQLPKFEDDLYKIPSETDLYLIPTAEVPVTNFFRDKIIDEKELPIKCTAFTPCFRREAGSYGKDVRGLNRLHQFDKVEIVQIQHPNKSYHTLDVMVSHVADILDELGLPYRIVQLCSGDLSFSSALTFDFEVFSAAQEKWLEVSSVSNFESYQANRLKLRYRDKEGKKNLCHTLNGSALALPRIFAALIENMQTSEGIMIPKVLHPYTGFDCII